MSGTGRQVQLVGGPFDGRAIEVAEGLHVVRVPQATEFANAVRVIDLPRKPSYVVHDYRLYGSEGRWEGMVDDAWAQMDVSEQVFVEGGGAVRAVLRQQLTASLQQQAGDRELDRRKVWRVGYDKSRMMFTVKAFVGPHRVKLAKQERTPQ